MPPVAEETRFIDDLRLTFRRQARDIHYERLYNTTIDSANVEMFESTLMAKLDLPDVQAAIAANTGDCGRYILVEVLKSVFGPYGAFSPCQHGDAVHRIVKRLLEIDTNNAIDVTSKFDVYRSPIRQKFIAPLLTIIEIVDDPAFCQMLVDRGADVTSTEFRGHNCVTIAALGGRIGVLQWLLAKFDKSDALWLNRTGASYFSMSAACVAATANHFDVLEFLQRIYDRDAEEWHCERVFAKNFARADDNDKCQNFIHRIEFR